MRAGVNVIVGVAVSVGMSVAADTGVCAVEVSAGLAVSVAIGVGDTSDSVPTSGVQVAVADGVALGNAIATRSAGSSTCAGVGAGVIISCCTAIEILGNTSYMADSTINAPMITPTSATNAAIRQGRWRRRTARQWLPPLGRRRWV